MQVPAPSCTYSKYFLAARLMEQTDVFLLYLWCATRVCWVAFAARLPRFVEAVL
jgi:hypothetical protein